MELMVDHITKQYKDVKAVTDMSYTFSKGVYGLLGVNGAGKTTLMRMLCTLIKPSAGKITLDGQEIWEMEEHYRRKLGYLPQDFGYYPDFTAEDYLMYIASIKGIRLAAARKRTKDMLVKVGLASVARKRIKGYSGGMKRRLGIAQAMLNNPEILILDEPTAGLDPNERIRFRNLISELAEDRLVLLSTHIVSDVEYIAKEILFMKDGQITCSGTLDDLLTSTPIHVYQCVVSRTEADQYQKAYRTANLKRTPDGILLRLLADHPPCASAVEDEITLEDIFLYHFGEKAGIENVLL